MIAGCVDAFGFINYKTYVSFMSGNTTQTGVLIGQDNLAAAVPFLLAILFFLIGVFTGTLITRSGGERSRRLRLPLSMVATLLAIVICLAQFGAMSGGVGIAMLSLAMGVMNTTLSRVGAQAVHVVFVTGTLNALVQHLALAIRDEPLSEARGTWDTHGSRAFFLAAVWGSFLVGALLAGFATPRLGVWVLLLPVLILLVLAPAR
jgi:uncharacterized membrane protein YoaK (UPF0700 family)